MDDIYLPHVGVVGVATNMVGAILVRMHGRLCLHLQIHTIAVTLCTTVLVVVVVSLLAKGRVLYPSFVVHYLVHRRQSLQNVRCRLEQQIDCQLEQIVKHPWQ